MPVRRALLIGRNRRKSAKIESRQSGPLWRDMELSLTFYHREAGSAMSILELENRVAEIRAKPLQLVCVTRKGEKRVMSIRECRETEARFLHVAADDLDKLLGAELGGDAEYP